MVVFSSCLFFWLSVARRSLGRKKSCFYGFGFEKPYWTNKWTLAGCCLTWKAVVSANTNLHSAGIFSYWPTFTNYFQECKVWFKDQWRPVFSETVGSAVGVNIRETFPDNKSTWARFALKFKNTPTYLSRNKCNFHPFLSIYLSISSYTYLYTFLSQHLHSSTTLFLTGIRK